MSELLILSSHWWERWVKFFSRDLGKKGVGQVQVPGRFDTRMLGWEKPLTALLPPSVYARSAPHHPGPSGCRGTGGRTSPRCRSADDFVGFHEILLCQTKNNRLHKRRRTLIRVYSANDHWILFPFPKETMLGDYSQNHESNFLSFFQKNAFFKKPNRSVFFFILSRWPGLNWWPRPYQGRALPTELQRPLLSSLFLWRYTLFVIAVGREGFEPP